MKHYLALQGLRKAVLVSEISINELSLGVRKIRGTAIRAMILGIKVIEDSHALSKLHQSINQE